MHDSTFLQTIEPKQVHKRQRRRTRFQAFWVTLLVFVLIWIVVFCLALGQVVAKTLNGKEALQRAEGLVSSMQLEQAKAELLQAKQAFADAGDGLVLVKTVGVVPYVRTQVTHLERLLTSGIDIVDSLTSLLSLGEDLVRLSGLNDTYFKSLTEGISGSVSFNDLPIETKQVILRRLHASAEELELMTTRIRVSREELMFARQDLGFESMLGFLDKVSQQLEDAEGELQTLTTLARVLPEFAGLGVEKSHLILLLNNDELRPGGGFIGTYGLMNVQDAEIRSLRTKDVYALDQPSEGLVNVPAPEPMQKYNATPVLYMRDANWSPDFAVSSVSVINQFLREAENLPENKRTEVPWSSHIDGVIGFTPEFISGLLSITGPLTVAGQEFNAQTIAQTIEFQVEKGFEQQGIAYDQRKEILSDLVSALTARLFTLPFSQWNQVFEVTHDAFVHKQLFLYSSSNSAEEVITRVGWGGRVEPGATDVQLVVDANLASLKTDPEVKRSITYQISKNSTGQYLGRTTIRYQHEGSFDWRTTRYRTYTRLYLPKGTRFIRGQGMLENDKTLNPELRPGTVDVSEELEMSVFGAFISIEPGRVGELSFDYELAPSVVQAIQSGTYNLEVLKQNGARNYALTLGLDFDKKVSNASPAEERGSWGNDRYDVSTLLDQDKKFQVNL